MWEHISNLTSKTGSVVSDRQNDESCKHFNTSNFSQSVEKCQKFIWPIRILMVAFASQQLAHGPWLLPSLQMVKMGQKNKRKAQMVTGGGANTKLGGVLINLGEASFSGGCWCFKEGVLIFSLNIQFCPFICWSIVCHVQLAICLVASLPVQPTV